MDQTGKTGADHLQAKARGHGEMLSVALADGMRVAREGVRHSGLAIADAARVSLFGEKDFIEIAAKSAK